MSNDKLFLQISKCIESEDNYKKESENILQGVAVAPKNYTGSIIKAISDAFLANEKEARRKFLALQLLRDCMEIRQPLFVTSIAKSEILQILRKNVINFPKTEDQIKSAFVDKTNIDYAKKFYIFMLEWIKYWGEIYENEKEPFTKFFLLYKELLNKGANFQTNYSFMKVNPKTSAKQPQQAPGNAPKDNKDSKKKDDIKPQQMIEALRQGYEEILQQPFFYNAQELDIDDEVPVVGEQILADQQLEELPLPFIYNAKELEVDDDFDDVIEEEDLEQDMSMRQNSQIKVTVTQEAKKEPAANILKAANNQKPIEPIIQTQPNPVPVKHPAFDSDDSDDFAVIDSYQGNKPNQTKVPTIQGFPAKQGQAVPKQPEFKQTTYASEDKSKVTVQTNVPPKPTDSLKLMNSQKTATFATPESQSINNAPVETQNKQNLQVKQSEVVSYQQEPEQRYKTQQAFNIQPKAQPKISKDTITAVRHRSGSLEDDIEVKIETTSISKQPQKATTPKSNNQTSPISTLNLRPIGGNQPSSPKDLEYTEDEYTSQKVSKIDVKVNYEPDYGKKRNDKSLINKSIGENKSPMNVLTPIEKKEKFKNDRSAEYSVSIHDPDDSKINDKKKGSIIIVDGTSFHNKSQRQLLEIAARIASNESMRKDGKSFSEFQESRRDDTRSFTELGPKHLKATGDNFLSVIPNERNLKNAVSPNRQSEADKNGFKPILPTENNHNLENYFEKEINELKRKNEKLLDENQDLKIRNAQLEVKLTQELEKNKESKVLLEKKENELKSIQEKLESNFFSPKKGQTKAENSKVETPYGSPKSEFFRRKTIKAPKDTMNGTRPSMFQPHAPVEKSKNHSYSLAHMGPFLRKKLEDDDELYDTSTDKSNQLLYKTVSNTMIKTEYTSPKRDTTSPKYTSPVPTTNRRPFYSHNDILFSTDVEKFQLACLKNKERLFENQHIVVDVQTNLKDKFDERSKHLGITLTFINKTHREMDEFSVTYKSVPGFVVSAETTEVEQKLNPRGSQVHKLNAEMTAHSDRIGIMIIEYRMDDEPYQWKLHCPIVMTKFFEFLPISSSDFIRRRKTLQTQYPNNTEESPKIYLSQSRLDALKEYLLTKMTIIQADKGTVERFTLFGGCIKTDIPDRELLVRLIIENETQIAMVQVNYDDGCEEFAKDYIAMLILLCNEKTVL